MCWLRPSPLRKSLPPRHSSKVGLEPTVRPLSTSFWNGILPHPIPAPWPAENGDLGGSAAPGAPSLHMHPGMQSTLVSKYTVSWSLLGVTLSLKFAGAGGGDPSLVGSGPTVSWRTVYIALEGRLCAQVHSQLLPAHS